MKILRIAAAVEDRFSESCCLPVHSIYKNTVNLQCGAEILAIQTLGLQATPFSVEITAAPGSLETLFGPAKSVSVSPAGLLAGQTLIVLPERYEIYNGHFRAGKPMPDPVLAARVIREVLWRLAPRDSFFALAEPQRLAQCGRFSGAAEGAAILDAALQLPTTDTSMQKLSELVGLGQGLTPAGDDFLLGILAALDLVGKVSERGALCAALQLQKTNQISAAFLQAAKDSVYAECFLLLMQTLAVGATPEEIGRCAVRVLQTGHTSGSDTLSGLLWCLETIERKRQRCFLTAR